MNLVDRCGVSQVCKTSPHTECWHVRNTSGGKYLSSQTLITPSSRGIMTAALTSSLQPSNFDRRTGLRLLLNLSWFTPGAGFISAAISQTRVSNPANAIVIGPSLPKSEIISKTSYGRSAKLRIQSYQCCKKNFLNPHSTVHTYIYIYVYEQYS